MAKHGISLAALLIILAATGHGAWAQQADAQAATPAGAESINIFLSDYAFAPAALNLKAGTAYHLHFTNAGSKDHNFTAPEFFTASQVAPEDQAKIKRGTVAVEKGKEVDVTVTPGAGNYKVTCTNFMHSMMGMHGTITVQ
jgi:plastocyanin